MARNHYVNSKKRKTSYKTKKRKTKTSRGKRLFLILFWIAILFFVLYIFFIRSSTSPSQPIIDPVASQIQKSDDKRMPVLPPEHTLPEKPSERWDYLKCLEMQNCSPSTEFKEDFSHIQQELEKQNMLQIFDAKANSSAHIVESSTSVASTSQTVSTTTPSTQNRGSQLVEFQCGAFSMRQNAEALHAKLTFLGIKSFIESKNSLSIVVITFPENEQDHTLQMLEKQNIVCSKRA